MQAKENDFFYHGTYLKGISGRRTLSEVLYVTSPMNQDPFLCPFICLSVLLAVFLETGHQFFLTPYMVLGAQIGMCVTARFFWKNPHGAEMTKNGQKWPLNSIFLTCSKSNKVIGFCMEMVQNESTYIPFTVCRNRIPGRNLVLKFWPKLLLASEIPVGIICQILLTD